MELPPDRGHLRTEQRHGASTLLDAMPVAACVELMIEDHATVTDAVAAASGVVSEFIETLLPRMRAGGRLIYVGAGTSGRLGVLDAAECPPTFQSDPDQVIGILAGGDAALRRSSEGLEDDADGAAPALEALHLTDRDTVVGIAAGATTPFVLGALRIAKTARALTTLITCVSDPGVSPSCDHTIALDTGPEILTGSTRLKAGSATKLVLNIITTTVFARLGKVYGNLMVDVRATNAKLTDRALRILAELAPGLDRTEAQRLLERASGSVKVAILMHRLDVDRPSAERLLAEHDGHLRAALDSKEDGTRAAARPAAAQHTAP